MTIPPSAPHLALRAATASDHQSVDDAFGHFDLTTHAGYAGFLRAHARTLPAVETALAGHAAAAPLRPRTQHLAADLAALGEAMPAPAALDPPASDAEAWGMAYVIEGSRLGGRLLARGVPADLPSAYLSDIHESGEWRAFLAALDAALADPEALAAAIPAAKRAFALYGNVAAS